MSETAWGVFIVLLMALYTSITAFLLLGFWDRLARKYNARKQGKRPKARHRAPFR